MVDGALALGISGISLTHDTTHSTDVYTQYLLIPFETDITVLRSLVPWPLAPKSNIAVYEWINMMDSSGWDRCVLNNLD